MSDMSLVDRFGQSLIELGDNGEYDVMVRGGKNRGSMGLNYRRQLQRELGSSFSAQSFVEWSRRGFTNAQYDAEFLKDAVSDVCSTFAKAELLHLSVEERERVEAFKKESIDHFPDSPEDMWLGWYLLERELGIT